MSDYKHAQMVDYKDTLNLPKTLFSMRAGLAEKEPAMLAQWHSMGLWSQIREAHQGQARFVLHDGPPYANGHLHQGHILNKVLKDLVVKDRTMAGFDVPFVPGWDCHGLPIEVQVDKALGAKKRDMSKSEIRRACRAYAQEYVQIQRDEFERLGVFGRWDEPYLTMNFGYEATTLRELARFVDQGLLYKGLRPVNWCTTHQTALAEAEVEFADKTSPSIYVAFPLASYPEGWDSSVPLDVMIWTTTPWTLPGNMAVAVHKDFTYVAYPIQGKMRLLAKDLLGSVLAVLHAGEVDVNLIAGTWSGVSLVGMTYRHVLFARTSPIVCGDHVTLEAGTGCVHTAPGHGADDFEIGRREGLEILSPVDAAGLMTVQAGQYAGLHVDAAAKQIIEDLASCGALLSDPGLTIQHRYAHCWRCNRPIILRATEQWWVAVDKAYGKQKKTLREQALNALNQVEWLPAWGKDRISGMLTARPDWCLSRQRVWGVPIAVLYCESCEHPLLDADLMRKVADCFEQEGADAWFDRSVEELLGEVKCPKCKGKSFRKETDILDVWFDSGVSFSAVIEREKLGLSEKPPIDLYLEGSDQHRGWFHSSLLCSLATREEVPFRQVLTHGFVVDGQGKKISKSKGNFVDPFAAIKQDGAEVLRLWVASEEYREDIRLSKEILTRLTEMYRKIRNTLRFLLASLDGFDPNTDLVRPEVLYGVDVYALSLVNQCIEKVKTSFEGYIFHHGLHAINELCTVDLSAFYLDVLKDRLYASPAASHERRSAQSVLYMAARDLIRVLAPVLCFTADEAWSHLPKIEGDPDSVHLTYYPGDRDPAAIGALRAFPSQKGAADVLRYAGLRALRPWVNTALEVMRRDHLIGSSTEAAIVLPSEKLGDLATQFTKEELGEFFIVSQASVGNRLDDITIHCASGGKCPRCWLYRDEITSDGTVCRRCADALLSIGKV